MDNLGQSKLCIPRLVQYFGELGTSTTVTTMTFTGMNPTPSQFLQELTLAESNQVILLAPAAPAASTLEVTRLGVYTISLDLIISNPAGGGERSFELSVFVNGFLALPVVVLIIGVKDTNASTFTSVRTLFPNSVFDFRIRKLTGTDITLDIERFNVYVHTNAHEFN